MADSSKKLTNKITSISYLKHDHEDYVASVGGKVLRINRWFTGTEFSEIARFQYRERANNFVDVGWQEKNGHFIATSLNTGQIQLWKYDWKRDLCIAHTYEDCQRSVNSLTFDPYRPNLLYAGSQSQIVVFDLREKKLVSTYLDREDAVRDLRFPYSDRSEFATAHDSGKVMIWDTRKSDKCLRVISCHAHVVFSCDWHPTNNQRMVTAGRDQYIKVWDLSDSVESAVYTILTYAGVRKVRWRPGHDDQCASYGSMAWDCDINIWDLSRTYIPVAVLKNHSQVISGLIWRDSNSLISSSADNRILLDELKNPHIPAKDATPSSLTFNAYGHLCTAIRTPVADKESKTVDENDNLFKFCNAYHHLQYNNSVVTSYAQNLTDDRKIYYLAKHYLITGKLFGQICDHNREVADKVQLHHIAQTWSVLKVMYQNYSTQNDNRKVSIPDLDHFGKDLVLDEDDTDGSLSDDAPSSSYAFTSAMSDDGEIGIGALDGEVSIFSFQAPGHMPTEAFEYASLENDGTPTIGSESQDRIERASCDNSESYSKPTELVADLFVTKPTPEMIEVRSWKFSDIIPDLLKSYADEGDVQTCVSIIAALGERFDVTSINEETVVNWYNYYLEILDKFELWNAHNELIKTAHYSAIRELSFSWPYNTGCNNCKKVVNKAGCCNICKKQAALCSVCHLPVKGLYVWCHGCGHGGHLQHMKEWIKKNHVCPTGCKHRCEYD
ncbi:WD repeat-containing protein 24 [Trichoplax sp. H2]|nr:WD repeat-containing protein 24 [Trichoplax sp. H2]|eukprot:RDD42689.1 WD repeat-containing protein 24 [Trichoplax sp. H2]